LYDELYGVGMDKESSIYGQGSYSGQYDIIRSGGGKQ